MLKSLKLLMRIAIPQRSYNQLNAAPLIQFRMFGKKSKSGNSSGEES